MKRADSARLFLLTDSLRTCLPENLSLEEGLTVIVQRLVERITREAPSDRAGNLVTQAFLLTGLRLPRDVATRVFQGVPAMQESDTYLAILDEGQEKHARKAVMLVGQEKCGSPSEEVKNRIEIITDLERLDRMLRRAVTANTWDEILDTP